MLATVDAALSKAAPGTQQGYGEPGEEAAQRGTVSLPYQLSSSSMTRALLLRGLGTSEKGVWGWVSGEVQQQEMEGFLCAEWEESQDHPALQWDWC